MERARVLISASPDEAKNLHSRIFDIDGVRLADLVRGEFALIVAIELPDRESLARAVDDIRQLEGVEKVLVCEVVASRRVPTRGPDRRWP